jgi:hypothetical protein
MNKKVKAKWVAALRGGLYKQGFGQLRDPEDRCCCLGVLCDVVAPKKWHRSYKTFAEWEHGGQWALPCKSIISYSQAEEFILMNDKRKYSFKKIANWIDKNL